MNEFLPLEKDEEGDPYTPQRLYNWLRAKYIRHGEDEDRAAANMIRRLADLHDVEELKP